MNKSTPRPMAGGFVLVEVIVAVTLLMIVLPALAGLTFQVARRSLRAETQTHRTAVVSELIGRLSVLPLASLVSVACVENNDPPFPHEWCVTVDDVALNEREVMVVVTSTLGDTRPDTVYLLRTGGVTNPFDTR